VSAAGGAIEVQTIVGMAKLLVWISCPFSQRLFAEELVGHGHAFSHF
jgi:hypothetical protein